jgi:hypothetical protein
MSADGQRFRTHRGIRLSLVAGGALAVTCLFAGARGVGPWAPRSGTQTPGDAGTTPAEAVVNLERQTAKLTARDGASCPQEFAALDGDGPLRISLFHGYDDHEGRVYDRVNSRALLQVLSAPCRGRLAACGFSVASRSESAATLAKSVRSRRVEIQLFTSSLPEGVRERDGAVAAHFAQKRLSRSVRERFHRELVESDVVFYMGHSRLGGSLGFDDQAGATTLVDAVLRRRMAPVLEALRRRPTRLRILGMFSCASKRYFGPVFEQANPSLSLILTTGELGYVPGEQTSLGALEAILSRYCGRAFHEAMIAASEPDPAMTRLYRGR